MATAWVPTNRVLANSQPVEAGYSNQPINDLIQRTQYLKEQLDSAVAGTHLAIRSQIVTGVTDGQAVYFDNASQSYKPAVANTSATAAAFQANSSTYWQGIAVNVAGGTADIIMGGAISKLTTEWATVFTNGQFAAGEIYLGENTSFPGKISATPGSYGVYIGHMSPSGQLVLRLGAYVPDNDHVHIRRALTHVPAGTLVDPVFGGTHVITAPNPAVVGWLPATSTYFPGFVLGVQIPTGAKFGYNIQHANEAALREVFPIVPVSNVEFDQGGLILSPAKVIVNNFGIWWMLDTYGNAPWPTDYNTNGGGSTITLWTTRLQGQTSFNEQVTSSVTDFLSSTTAEPLIPTSVKTDNQLDLEIVSTHGDNSNGFTGDLTLKNKGVTVLRPGRGVGVTNASLGGNITDGYKGLVDLESTLQIPIPHIWTEQLAVADKVAPITTNGVASGTYNNLRGHVLGVASTDYIDFVIHLGTDLVSGVSYKPEIRVAGAVNTASGTPTAAAVGMECYVYAVGDPASSTKLVRTTTLTVTTGTPGAVQQSVVGPFADLLVTRNSTLHLRIKAAASGTPVPAGSFRVIAVTLGLIKV